jgi:hypothetical protein
MLQPEARPVDGGTASAARRARTPRGRGVHAALPLVESPAGVDLRRCTLQQRRPSRHLVDAGPTPQRRRRPHAGGAVVAAAFAKSSLAAPSARKDARR